MHTINRALWNNHGQNDNLQLDHSHFEGTACKSDDTEHMQKHKSLGAALVYDLKNKNHWHITIYQKLISDIYNSVFL